MRMMLEDIPMTVCQLYSIYRRQISLTVLGYLGLVGSIFGIYSTITEIWAQIMFQIMAPWAS